MNTKLATIILAAGKGSRMQSSTPKVLHLVGEKPMIQHVIDISKELKSEKIIVVLGYKADEIANQLSNETLQFVFQFDQLGTAHAVLQCKKSMNNYNGDVLILSGDVPLITASTISQLIKVHKKNDAWCTLLSTDLPNPMGYGRIIRDNNNNLSKIIEDKDASEDEKKIREINSGIYVFKTEHLFRLLPHVKDNNKQKEYYLPDVLNLIIKEHGKIAIKKTANSLEVQGINNLEQLKSINLNYIEK